MHHVVHHVQFLKISVRGKIGHMKEYGDVIVRTGSDQMKKAQKKLTLSKIDFLSSVIIIGLD